MRIRFFLAMTSLCCVSAGLAVQACGGSSDDNPGSPDTGVAEASADTAAKDSAVDVFDAGPACDPNTDFLGAIPDASIADGSSTTGLCVSCTKTNCSAEVAKCAKDCPCQDIGAKALSCFAKTQDVFGCAAQFAAVPKATQTIGIALFGCVQKQCAVECAASSFLDAGDGGD